MKPGQKVKIKGLVNAAQHNGKVGKVTKSTAPDGRVGVKVDNGKILAIKPENLEVQQTSTATATSDVPGQRTLKRDNALLREFDGSPDPNTLALYYHFADSAFDAYNAPELISQLLQYYQHNLQLKLVCPRSIGHNQYYLLCLQHNDHTKNTLCQLAFNCGRSFTGICTLVKKRCFACYKPNVHLCKDCLCACFCSDKCRNSEIGRNHDELCKQVDVSKVVLEEESLSLIGLKVET